MVIRMTSSPLTLILPRPHTDWTTYQQSTPAISKAHRFVQQSNYPQASQQQQQPARREVGIKQRKSYAQKSVFRRGRRDDLALALNGFRCKLPHIHDDSSIDDDATTVAQPNEVDWRRGQ